MYVLNLLSGFVLLHQGSTLVCNKCDTREDTCDREQIQCPADSTHCGTYEVVANSEPYSTYGFMNGGCFKAVDCQTVMFDFYMGQITHGISCCDTDKCNTGRPTMPRYRENPNGKKCYSCGFGEKCDESLDCYGEQTYCVTMTDNGKMRKGCATKNICDNPPPYIKENIKNITCCDTDFCNGDTKSTEGNSGGTGSTLVCNKCDTREDTCDREQIQCPADSTHCGTYEVVANSEPYSTYGFMNGGCFKAVDCQTVMFDFYMDQITHGISCCDTDKCNTGRPTMPRYRENPNGKKCYSCGFGEKCDKSLDCYGEQTYCVTMTDNGKMRKGCATKNICDNPPPYIKENIKNITCCDTDFCNGDTKSTEGNSGETGTEGNSGGTGTEGDSGGSDGNKGSSSDSLRTSLLLVTAMSMLRLYFQ